MLVKYSSALAVYVQRNIVLLRMIYIPCFQSMATRNPIEMPVRARARACVQVDMVTRFPLVPVLVRLLSFVLCFLMTAEYVHVRLARDAFLSVTQTT
jgi:hypothetical protein